MTILTEIYNAFDPTPLPATSKMYVDCKEVRGGSDVLVELGKTIRFSDRPTCQLYTGHRGSGKSTELLRLKKDLEEKGCTVVYFSAEDEDVNTEDVEYTDILLACTRHLLESVREADPQPVLNWLRERAQAFKDALLTEIIFDGPEVEFGIQEFAKITTSIKTQSKRAKLRDLLNPYTESLVYALNAFIDDARKKLPKGQNQLVVIADGLEKITLVTKEGGRTNHDEIFIDRAEQLKGLNCDVIYTVPISLLLSTRASDLMEIYNYEPQVLPMVAIKTRTNTLNSNGIEVLRNIIGRRVSSVLGAAELSLETEIFDSPETLERLCLMSGGHIRNLVRLVQTAIKYNEGEFLPIQAIALNQAVRQLRKIYRDTVDEGQWLSLANVHLSKQISNDDDHRSLLFSRCLLEYRDELIWYDVHPVLLDAIEFRDAIQQLNNSVASVQAIIRENNSIKNLILSKIEIENIRCFKSLMIDFCPDKDPTQWAMIVGDNAVGKSTILRCIALGLCDESSAIALMKTLSGEFIKQDAEEGCIKIYLVEQDQLKKSKQYTITTRIKKNSSDRTEIIRQETKPIKNFPWADIFICGYGAYRAAQAHSSFEKYEIRNAVATLFDSQAALQNPEVVLLRHHEEVRKELEKKLLEILMLDEPEYKINSTMRGLELDGPWGCLPFQVLSDGYRSTTQWVLDFIGWLIHAHRLINNPGIGGILLIDELEQHLHPRWQRYIVQRLRRQFPKTQIIASTHTPLVASGIVDEENSILLKLVQQSDQSIFLQVIDIQQLAGKRADQVLTSRVFDLITTRNPGSQDEVDRYTELLSKVKRSNAEEIEFQYLKKRVQNIFRGGENYAEQIVESAVDEALQTLSQDISPEMLDIETQKQLYKLFHMEDDE